MSGILQQLFPVGAAEPAAKNPRRETRRRIENPHGAAPWIESDHRAGPIPEGLGRRTLKLDIERQPEIVTGCRLGFADHAELPTNRRRHDPPLAGGAGDEVILCRFDPGRTDHGIRLEARIGGDLRFRDRAEMTHHVRRQLAVGVMPAKTADYCQLRIVALVRAHRRYLFPAQVFTDHQRCHAADAALSKTLMKYADITDADSRKEDSGCLDLVSFVRE